ncbi:expression site-associated gene (ESAG) protein,putative [Trypanosoma brucei gambiense DAL972]|uniref:Expression site-associated gene (ESAG) protein,putative n=1 Tax=Trypanosoma brucei gambiense (strain MHOM/CI/86/DAL972) TaxID=679716 RepID=C9ZQ09_TRYB9|nr:expression site-associated gene (ESAG) protein,putative [Trypanosoma brucei gambiense DAL972]CBH11487.1 expression site-associated gene (ESAG) protein,putative [Trypanosoma brucei gambiense DAL972]|eukprot:XP_011773774.1 expression site-associated gene (ESAG) protein,putative [Trypanosoma brucei gambiense DAL972]
MIVAAAGYLFFIIFVLSFSVAEECMLVADVEGEASLNESVCYLSCLSNALSKLYTDGEQRMLVSEEVYANASRILDDMEGKAGECVKYLSAISGVMEGKHDKLEKLISYGNEMGDLVAKVGGLFSDVNESVRAVRKKLPDALMKANKYYTSVAEVVRTVWDDVKGVGSLESRLVCDNPVFESVRKYHSTCPDYKCPFDGGVSTDAFRKYKNECLEIVVYYYDRCRAQELPRDRLYRGGIVGALPALLDWGGREHNYFKLILEIRQMFAPLISPLASGLPPSVLLATISNITSYYTHFNKVHANFTSLLIDADLTDNVNGTNFTI